MMALLWTAQLNRDGTDDESHPLTVSQEQPEAAAHLAVTLVHWCRSGTFERPHKPAARPFTRATRGGQWRRTTGRAHA